MKKPLNSPASLIFQELLRENPDLHDHEAEIIAIIEKMQQQEPNVSLSADFQKNLSQKISHELLQMKRDPKKTPKKSLAKISWLSRSWFYGFFTALSCACLGIILFFSYFDFSEHFLPDERVQEKYQELALRVGNHADMALKTESLSLAQYQPVTYPYLEYVYTGSLDGILADLPVYRQNIPQEDHLLQGYQVYDSNEPIQYSGFHPESLDTVSGKKMTVEKLRESIRTQASYGAEKTEWQEVVTIALVDPKVVYTKEFVFDDTKNETEEYYVPALRFQVWDHSEDQGIPSEVIIPYISLQ